MIVLGKRREKVGKDVHQVTGLIVTTQRDARAAGTGSAGTAWVAALP